MDKNDGAYPTMDPAIQTVLHPNLLVKALTTGPVTDWHYLLIVQV